MRCRNSSCARLVHVPLVLELMESPIYPNREFILCVSEQRSTVCHLSVPGKCIMHEYMMPGTLAQMMPQTMML